jgi:hypothetical protein
MLNNNNKGDIRVRGLNKKTADEIFLKWLEFTQCGP